MIGYRIIITAVVFALLGFAMLSKPEPKLVEPEPQRWRSYVIDRADVYEWRDDWGRVCTWTYTRGGREQALDCDYPQENTP